MDCLVNASAESIADGFVLNADINGRTFPGIRLVPLNALKATSIPPALQKIRSVKIREIRWQHMLLSAAGLENKGPIVPHFHDNPELVNGVRILIPVACRYHSLSTSTRFRAVLCFSIDDPIARVVRAIHGAGLPFGQCTEVLLNGILTQWHICREAGTLCVL